MPRRERILAKLSERVPLYTPEWRFNRDNPDAGAALALLWTDMLEGTLKRYESLPDNYRRALLDAIGSEPRPALHARAWLKFDMRDDAGEVVIPSGTAVLAPSNPDAALTTGRDLAASPAKITDIYCVIPARDAVYRYDGLTDQELFRAPSGGLHVWTFAHPYAFNVSERATLRLAPRLDGGETDALAAGRWEFLDGDAWRDLTLTRDGAFLRCSFPADKENVCAELRVTATRESAGDTVLSELAAFPSGQGLFADALYADGAQEAEDFYPFGQRFMPGNCAYFANSDALTKPGARVELSFTLRYDDFEIEGYPEREARMKKLMRVSDLAPPEEYEITAADARWEYWNGMGWATLGAEAGARLFDGKTDGRVKISFICPADLQSAIVGAHELPFVRARLIEADNLFRQRGHYKAPRVTDVRFDYRYSNGVPIQNVSGSEHLDARKGYFPVKLAAPPDGPAALYFAFDRAFSQGTILFDMAPGAPPPMRWEYLSAGGFIALNVRDDTAGLRKTGILSYQASSPAIQGRLWGREAYWMRLAAEDRSYTGELSSRPHLNGLFENAVYAAAREPGEASVLPANAFTTLSSPVPGAEGAANPIAAYGGADAESEEHIIARLTAALYHQGRVVSAGDLENLALESSSRVLRARCYAHTDENGLEKYGESCLVLLPRGARLLGFPVLRDEVRAYIESRRALGAGRLHIVPPRFTAVNVAVRAVIGNPDEALSVKQRISEVLAKLLTPADWAIGQLPTPGRIETELRAVQGIVSLLKTETTYLRRGVAAEYARAADETFVLPVNGNHDIVFEN
jgi:hypothetical protein